MYRHFICIVGLSLVAGCQHRVENAPVPVVDFLREFARAEKAPAAGFALATYEENGIVRAAIVVPVPSRLTVPLPLPRRSLLRVSVALDGEDPSTAVRFRVRRERLRR